ncbi:MAG TPA: sugar ABC transporter permease [Streptosporangiaceae bacterium]|nr:sugar ABC transporter permease [Streptosporangiaceae bacterium]
MSRQLGLESAGSQPGLLGHESEPVPGGPSHPGPDRPGLSRRLAQAGWSAFDRRFFRLAVIPAFLAVFLVTVIPFVAGFGLSFSSMNSVNNHVLPPTLANYKTILTDPVTHTVLLNTVIYVVAAVVLETGFGLLLGVLLASKHRLISGFRVIFLLPLTVASVAAAISWSALLNTSQGWINYYLGLLHLPQPNWLASSTAAMPSVVITDMWSGIPVVAVIVLAALIGAPRDPIEAAMVDGAGAWNRFRYVTFPAIRPALVLAALLRTVAAFQQFALFEILTGGGPGLSTTVINFYVYQQTIVYGNVGYGAALAVLLVVVMAVPLLLLFALSRRR